MPDRAPSRDAQPRSTRERQIFAFVALALTALSMLPVWVSRFLPLLDEPNHLSTIAIWRGLAEGGSSFAAFYKLHIVPVSYLAHYGLAFALSWLTGVEV